MRSQRQPECARDSEYLPRIPRASGIQYSAVRGVTDTPWNFIPLGDTAITIPVGEGISQELSEHVVRRASLIRTAGIPGVTDVVSSYASLVVHYNPLTIGYHDLRERLRSLSVSSAESSTERDTGFKTHVIPVRYDGEDLDDVARRTGLSTDEVIRIHSSAIYRVLVIGFVPGFAYMGPLDERLVIPRKESPRKRVPAGSVAIAESQTGIYPSATPGGWHILGTTAAKMFDALASPPALFAAGDVVRFEVVQ